MFYYRIELAKKEGILREADEDFIKSNQWFYCFDNENQLYFVLPLKHKRKELSDKIKKLLNNQEKEVDFKFESIGKKKYFEKLGNKYSNQFTLLYFQLDEKEKPKSVPFTLTDMELKPKDIIGLRDFKNYLLKLSNFLESQKERRTKSKEEVIEHQFLIFKGSAGTGRKFAIQYLLKLLDIQSTTILKYSFDTQVEDGKRLVIVKDYSCMTPRRKETLQTNILEEKEGKIFIFLADSDKAAQEIRQDLTPIFHQVHELNFPNYSQQELLDIMKFRLKNASFDLEKFDVAQLNLNQTCLKTSHDSCYLAQSIMEYAANEDGLVSQGKKNPKLFLEETANLKASDGDGLTELDQLIGLSTVKDLVRKVLAYTEISQKRVKLNSLMEQQPMHLLFSGAAGTGKTIVARLLARILHEHGLIQSNHLLEVGRADLIGEYVGQTAPKIKNIFQQAKGGILFIDEAYSLIPQSERDFANEALPALVQEMENNREDVIVIFAGYSEMMQEFLKTNQGLASRISREICFENYSQQELYEILTAMANKKGYLLDQGCKEELLNHFEKSLSEEGFGNARYVRKLLELAMYTQAERLIEEQEEENLSAEKLNQLLSIDFTRAIQDLKRKRESKKEIGFRVAN